MQIHDEISECTELIVTARFAATIGFYTWLTLGRQHYPDPAALSSAWQADVQRAVQQLQNNVTIGRSEADSFEAMDKAFCQLAFSDAQEVLATPVFKPSQDVTNAPAQQELLRYVLDQLMPSASHISCQSAGLPPDTAQGEDYTVAAWQASDADNQHSGVQTYTRLLHSMLLLWKLAWTALRVSDTEHTCETDTAIATLIQAVGGLCDQLKRYDQAAVEGMTSAPPQAVTTEEARAAAKKEAERAAERNKSLSLMLVILVKRTLTSVVNGPTPEADVCCNIMSALMMKSQPSIYQAVAKAIVAKGEIPTTSSARQDVVDVLDDHCT